MGRRRLVLFAVPLIVAGALTWSRLSAPTAQPQSAAAQPAQQQAQRVSPADAAAPAELSSAAAAMLKANGFVVVPQEQRYPMDQLAIVYDRLQWERKPIFVTTDAALHVSHLVFDFYLRFLETTSLRQDLLSLTDSLLSKAVEYWDTANSAEIKQAALRDAGYFFVAKALLTGAQPTDMPADLKQAVERELALIEGHQGFAPSPLFGYKEDYSQYLPRGHYSRSPEFAAYFKAMIWYGRMAFRLGPPAGGVPAADADRETRQALLVCKALDEARVHGETALAVWRRIYDTTAYFAGWSDDLTPQDYLKPAEAAFGRGLSLEGLSDPKRLADFRRRAAELPRPRILSTYAVATEPAGRAWPESTMALRLMGQRFAPDSYVFNQLVFDRVGAYTGGDPKPFTWVNAQGLQVRGFPLGLDLLSVMGDSQAAAIIHAQGDDRYQGYDKQIAALRKTYTGMTSQPSDLYLGRLDAIRQALAAPAAGAPDYMSREPWRRKQLLTALGSWTELKHDTILYTKQPYGMAQAAFAVGSKGSVAPPPPPVHGYVEPSPQVFAAIETMADGLAARLRSLGFPEDRALDAGMREFAALMGSLKIIAQAELAGKALSSTDENLIEHIGWRFREALRFAHYLDVTGMFRSAMDHAMPIVADVNTDVNTRDVLEEAVGMPMLIYAVAPVDGKATVCRGVVYSHYEFKQPMRDRLTDERWRTMLREGKAPPPPANWTSMFVAGQGR